MTPLPSIARPRPCSRGFTLVEVSVVLAVMGVLVALATPSWMDQLTRSRRADATVELQRLQWAQERHLERHGHYAQRLDELRGASAGRSAGGHYRVELVSHGPQAYEVVAHAHGVQARDLACQAITLRVDGAISQRKPEGPCWSL